jgi:hypothetical protein
MGDLVASLMHGPAWRGRAGGWFGRLLLAMPLLLLCLLTALAALAGLAAGGLPGLMDFLMHTVTPAAAAALLTLALAIPPALASPLLPWLLPLWLAPVIGVAGCHLLPLPPRGLVRVGETAAVLLPVGVVYLAGAWAGISPRATVAAAASCGVPPLTSLRELVLPQVLAPLPRAGLLLFCLGLGVVQALRATPAFLH